MNPVVGNEGRRGPKFCQETVRTTLEKGPKVFLIDPPFLLRSPELDLVFVELVIRVEPGTASNIGLVLKSYL